MKYRTPPPAFVKGKTSETAEKLRGRVLTLRSGSRLQATGFRNDNVLGPPSLRPEACSLKSACVCHPGSAAPTKLPTVVNLVGFRS